MEITVQNLAYALGLVSNLGSSAQSWPSALQRVANMFCILKTTSETSWLTSCESAKLGDGAICFQAGCVPNAGFSGNIYNFNMLILLFSALLLMFLAKPNPAQKNLESRTVSQLHLNSIDLRITSNIV